MLVKDYYELRRKKREEKTEEFVNTPRRGSLYPLFSFVSFCDFG